MGAAFVVVLLSNPAAGALPGGTTYGAPYAGGTPIVVHNASRCGSGVGAGAVSANLTTGGISEAANGSVATSGDCATENLEAGVGLTFVAPRTRNVSLSTPPKRADSALVYDPIDGYSVLFGGCVLFYCGGVSNDTWTYRGGVWSQLAPASHPSARSYAAMTYDARDGYVLLFGGTNLGSTSFADTWAFAHGTWSNITPAHSPSARFGAGIAYDARDGYVVMFGGSRCWSCTTTLLNDSWTYAGGVWTNVTTSKAPSIRQPAQAMTYDAHDRYVVLFGGYIAGGWTLHDTWKYVAGVWTNISSATHPTSRGAPAFAYDPKDGYVLLYGGYSPPAFDSDTWSFLNGSWRLLATGGPPGALSNSVMTFDRHDGYALLFSGLYSSETWAYRGGNWTQPSSGWTVYAHWNLNWTASTSTNRVCTRWIVWRGHRFCSGFTASSASIQASVAIEVFDVTGRGTPRPVFGSTTPFADFAGGYSQNSPPGGLDVNASASGGMVRNHRYLVETFVVLTLQVTGNSYTMSGISHPLAASASFDMASPYGGTLSSVIVAS